MLRRSPPPVALSFALVVFSSLAAAPAAAQSAAASPAMKIVKAGRLLDVRAGKYVSDQGILIDGEKIKEVGRFADLSARAPKDAVVVDLGSMTVLPGLIDAHAHLLDGMQPQWRTDEAILLTTQMSPASRALLGARMARETLEGGFTTVRNVGHAGPSGDVSLRDAIEAGWVPGPRVLACARKISPPGGQGVRMRSEIARLAVAQDYIGVTTPEEGRAAVLEDLAAGADFIKIVADSGNRSLSLETMKAIVDEARRAKVRVAAHATGERAIADAVEAGVSTIEHGDEATAEILKAMREKDVTLVDTVLFSTKTYTDFRATRLKLEPEEEREIAAYFDQDVEQRRKRYQMAAKAGVRIAAGSDMWFLWAGKTRAQATMLELAGLRDEGMPPADVLRAATMNAAEALGWGDTVGEIAAGKLADLIAVEGDPIADVMVLEKTAFVMKGGEIVKGAPAAR